MVAASVWSLLIPAMDMEAHKGAWSVVPASIGFLAGIGFLLVLDDITPHLHIGADKPEGPRSHLSRTFCVIEQDEVHPEKYTTFFRSVIAFGRIHIIEDETEKLETARMLGNRYNPNQEEALQKELENGLSRMLMIRFDIEHLTGKEAIELMRMHQK